MCPKRTQQQRYRKERGEACVDAQKDRSTAYDFRKNSEVGCDCGQPEVGKLSHGAGDGEDDHFQKSVGQEDAPKRKASDQCAVIWVGLLCHCLAPYVFVSVEA